MSDQIPSTSTKSAPNTPNSSNEKGKTQVFILSPDILKKLGIASKIPGLTQNKLVNVSAQNKNSESKNITLNKNISKPETCQQKHTIKNYAENEFSVKSKLISILTSKLEKEKVESTSDLLENKFDEQTNIENQIKPKDVINSNLIDTKVLNKIKNEIKKQISKNIIFKDNDKTKKTIYTDNNSSSKTNNIKNNTVVSEENLEIKESENNKLEISKKDEIIKINEPVKLILNKPIDAKESTKSSISSTNIVDSVKLSSGVLEGKHNDEIKNNISSELYEDKNNTIVTNQNLQTKETENNKSELKNKNEMITTIDKPIDNKKLITESVELEENLEMKEIENNKSELKNKNEMITTIGKPIDNKKLITESIELEENVEIIETENNKSELKNKNEMITTIGKPIDNKKLIMEPVELEENLEINETENNKSDLKNKNEMITTIGKPIDNKKMITESVELEENLEMKEIKNSKSEISKKNEIIKPNEPVKQILNKPMDATVSTKIDAVELYSCPSTSDIKYNTGTKNIFLSKKCKDKLNIVTNKNSQTDNAEVSKSELKKDNVMITTKEPILGKQIDNKKSITESEELSLNTSENVSLINKQINEKDLSVTNLQDPPASTTIKSEDNTTTENNLSCNKNNDENNTIFTKKSKIIETDSSSTSVKYSTDGNEYNKEKSKSSCNTNNEKMKENSHITEPEVNKKDEIVKVNKPEKITTDEQIDKMESNEPLGNSSINNSAINNQISIKALSLKSSCSSLNCNNEIKNISSSNDEYTTVVDSKEISQMKETDINKTIKANKLSKLIIDKQVEKKELSIDFACTSSTNIAVTDKQINKESISFINTLESCSSTSDTEMNTRVMNNDKVINMISNENSQVKETENNNTEISIVKTNKPENEVSDKQTKEATQPSSNTLKNVSIDKSIQNSENEINTNQNNTLVSKENIKLKTIETEQSIAVSKPETNVLEIKQEVYVTPKGIKRKITEESPVEDPDLTSIRKSGRKRKLSTLHSDYITELRLHDGSSTKITNTRRISSESKSVENNIENEKKSDTIIQKVNNKTKQIADMKLLQNIDQNEDHAINTNNKAIDVNSKNKFSSNIDPNKEKDISDHKYKKDKPEVLITQNTEADKNIENIVKKDESIIDNKLEKNDKNQVQNKDTGKSSTTLNLDVNVYVKVPPKIIIHENILIEPPTQENFTVMIPKRKYGKAVKQTKCKLSTNLNLESNKHFESHIAIKDKVNVTNTKSEENVIEKQDNKKLEINSEQKTTNDTKQNEKTLKTEPDTPLITPVRGRGRPQKSVIKQEVENLELDRSKNEESNQTPTIRRRGRPPKKDKPTEKVQIPEKIEKEELPNSNMSFYELPRRKGRPPKNEAIKRKVESMEMEESESSRSNKAKTVTCAICNEVIKTPLWSNHALKHNFLCWRVGDTPIDLNDRKLVEYILFKSIKNNSRFKSFVCTECGDRKKSVLGFLAHRDICQLSEEERIGLMLTCEKCSRKIMPQSMRFHMKSHEDENIKKEKLSETIKEIVEDRTKRKAATKAANLIQEVSSRENKPIVILEDVKNTQNRKMYKKIKESGSIFMNFGFIKRYQMLFKQGKRKCIFKACEFQTNDFEKLKKHMNSCSIVNPEHFICKFCQIVYKDENIMMHHVLTHEKKYEEFITNISSSESENECSENSDETSEEEEEEESTSKPKKPSKSSSEYAKLTFKIGFLANERQTIRNRVTSYLPALKWTEKFREQVYSDVLFEDIKCLASDWVSIHSNEYEQYLPSYRKSMSVKSCSLAYTIPNLQQKEHEWKEYDIYETDIKNDTANIFCGGPVTAMAWVPTPLNIDCNQILAVSIQKDFEATYKISESAYSNEMIQFWNFGPLNCSETNTTLPSLEFSIGHNHGMVWCMEWCPSGYYDKKNPQDSKELQKLGLLALACSDGNIPIYAIGIPEKNKQAKNYMYKIKPHYKLILQETSEELLGRWKYQATKVSWSKGENHNIIAGGYSNGVVCLWDLTNTSPLLQYEKNGVKILKPFHTFLAHTSAVSALVLYPFIDEGKRWLLTGSWDRSFKYWDINDTSSPVSSFGKRGNVTDGVWITHWLCSYFAFDDVFSLGHTVTTVQNPREFGFKQCSALASNSVVMGLSANDWASACAQGTLAGELITTFPRMILMSYDVDKHLKCKRMMFSYNELIDKTKDISERKDIMRVEKKQEISNENEKDDTIYSKYMANNSEPYVEEPTTYDKAKEKYGLLFCDFKLNNFNMLPKDSLNMVKQSCRLREVPTELYPFTSLNKIAWNPNKQAYLYIACGYQNGFVRLRCVRFMNSS